MNKPEGAQPEEEKTIVCWNCHKPQENRIVSPTTKIRYCEYCWANITPQDRVAA